MSCFGKHLRITVFREDLGKNVSEGMHAAAFSLVFHATSNERMSSYAHDGNSSG